VLTEEDVDITKDQLDDLLEYLVVTRVTAEFAKNVGVMFARAEAAGLV